MSERRMGGFSFFALWFGAAVSLAEIMTGSLLAPLGLKRGIMAVLAGHLIGTAVLALVGVIGFREKSPSLISSRLSLGRQGSYLVAILNILQLVGWTAIMIIQCGRSLQSITGQLFGFHNFAVLAVVTGVLVGIWALSTNKGINVVNNVAVILLLLLCLVMLKVLITGRGVLHPVAGSLSFGAALEMSVVMPLSWVPLISDYTMAGKSEGGGFWGSFIGYFLGSSFMYLIGILSALYAGTPDPISVLTKLSLGVPALLIVVLSTVTTTFMDVFSAVMSTLNLSGRLSRSGLILIFTLLGTVLALFFPMEQYQNFLYLIGSLFAPVFTVVLLDYFVFGADRSRTPFNLMGLAAVVLGVAVYYWVLRLDLPVGASLPAMAATAVGYLCLEWLRKNYLSKKKESYS